jgi:hypothetical protein
VRRGQNLDRLEPFVGAWRMQSSLGDVRAVTTFEWALGGAFLLQRFEIDMPEAPDGLCVIAVNEGNGGYTQHYFDSRGVVRTYAMAFDGRRWTLLRETPDFTPLTFKQRYTGEFSADGTRIVGRWEKTEPGGSVFGLDFELSYVRL